MCIKHGGGGLPPTPKDTLFPCGEGNLDRSTQFFFVHSTSSWFTSTVPPVEEPPATSPLLFSKCSTLTLTHVLDVIFLYPALRRENTVTSQVLFGT